MAILDPHLDFERRVVVAIRQWQTQRSVAKTDNAARMIALEDYRGFEMKTLSNRHC